MCKNIEDIFDFTNDEILLPFYTVFRWSSTLKKIEKDIKLSDYEEYKDTNCYKLLDNIFNKKNHKLTKPKFLIFYSYLFHDDTCYTKKDSVKYLNILNQPEASSTMDSKHLLSIYYMDKNIAKSNDLLNECIKNNHSLSINDSIAYYHKLNINYSKNEIYEKLFDHIDSDPYCVNHIICRYNDHKTICHNKISLEELLVKAEKHLENCKKYVNLVCTEYLVNSIPKLKQYINDYNNERIRKFYIKPSTITYDIFMKQETSIKKKLGALVNDLPLNDERLKIINYLRENDLMYKWSIYDTKSNGYRRMTRPKFNRKKKIDSQLTFSKYKTQKDNINEDDIINDIDKLF
jgi:hypothetical protein